MYSQDLLYFTEENMKYADMFICFQRQVNQKDMLKESSLQIKFIEILCITKGFAKLAENKRHFGV